jgi:hypothetical protein
MFRTGQCNDHWAPEHRAMFGQNPCPCQQFILNRLSQGKEFQFKLGMEAYNPMPTSI